MNSEKLMDSLEFLDEALLLEANEKRINRKKIIYIRSFSAAAACLLIIFAAAVVLNGPFKEHENILAGKAWRYLKEGMFVDLDDEQGNQFLVDATDTPSDDLVAESTPKPTTENYVLGPTATPKPFPGTGTNEYLVQGSTVTEKPNTNPMVPDETITNNNTGNSNGNVGSNNNSGNLHEGNTSGSVTQTASPSSPGSTGSTKPSVTASPADTQAPSITTPKPTKVPTASTPAPTRVPTTPTTAPTEDYSWITYIAKNEIITCEGDGQSYVEGWFVANFGKNDLAEPPVETIEPSYPGVEPPVETAMPTELPTPSESEPPSAVSRSWEYEIEIYGDTYVWQKKNVSQSMIGELLSSCVMYCESGTGVTKSTVADVYKIYAVSEEAAVAVKPRNNSGYYIFSNDSYRPRSFQDFVSDFSLRNNLVWKKMNFYNPSLQDRTLDSASMWNKVNNIEGTVVKPYMIGYNGGNAIGSMIIDMPLLGYKDVPIAVYSENYIMIGVFQHVFAFQLDADISEFQ